LLAAASLAAHADEKQKPWESEPPSYIFEDRLRLQVAVWNTNINTIVRADPTATQGGVGTTLVGETDLGLKPKKVTPDFELTFFPGQRQMLRLGGFSSERDGQARLTSRVQFHNDLFNTGETVKSQVDINMVGLTYGYRLLKGRWYDLVPTLRVQVATFTTNLQGSVTNTVRKADTITLPLPMVGAEGRLQIYKKLNFTGRYQWVSATVVDTSGLVREWQAGLLYQVRRNIGIEAAYRGYSIHVDSKSTDHPGTLDMKYAGWQLGFRASL